MLIGLIFFLILIAAMPMLSSLSAYRKNIVSRNEKLRINELHNLYEYKRFLTNVGQAKLELQMKLAEINYNNLPYQTYFTPMDIATLKTQIAKDIDGLEQMILQYSISPEEIQLKTEEIHKRIKVLTTPLKGLEYTLGVDEHDHKIVA